MFSVADWVEGWMFGNTRFDFLIGGNILSAFRISFDLLELGFSFRYITSFSDIVLEKKLF